jgi:hypothetical protein
MGEFSQQYCIVNRYDGAKDMLNAFSRDLRNPGVLRGCLVKVADGRLRIVIGQGDVVVDTPASEVVLTGRGKLAKVNPAVAAFDADGHHWVVDFSNVRKSEQAHAGGALSKIKAASALGNLKAISHGKHLALELCQVLADSGATAKSEA